MRFKTLLVEDDPQVADVVEFLLRELSHRVDWAEDGTKGWSLYRGGRYGLVVLDLGLPGLPGMEVFRRIREQAPSQLVVILTARGEEEDRVRGLNSGADDYVAKPFSNPEFQARVRNLLRRCPPPPERLRAGGLCVEPFTGRVWVGGLEVELPAHEFRLLETLLRHPRQTFTRDRLLDHMYGVHATPADRAVDQAVARLRRKLRSGLDGDGAVESVYGTGYRLSRGLAEEVT